MNACSLEKCHRVCQGLSGCVHGKLVKPSGPMTYTVESGANVVTVRGILIFVAIVALVAFVVAAERFAKGG